MAVNYILIRLLQKKALMHSSGENIQGYVQKTSQHKLF